MPAVGNLQNLLPCAQDVALFLLRRVSAEDEIRSTLSFGQNRLRIAAELTDHALDSRTKPANIFRLDRKGILVVDIFPSALAVVADDDAAAGHRLKGRNGRAFISAEAQENLRFAENASRF